MSDKLTLSDLKELITPAQNHFDILRGEKDTLRISGDRIVSKSGELLVDDSKCKSRQDQFDQLTEYNKRMKGKYK